MSDEGHSQVATLGMFILDSFRYDKDYIATQRPALDPEEWYIGGGGTYATIGARIWLPPDRITMIIHKGLDFPSNIFDELQNYSSSLFTFISDAAHPKTTRALNTYSNERRDFAYLTPKRQVRLSEIYSAKSRPPTFVHLVCSPIRMMQLLHERKKCFSHWDPFWIWEPVPDCCKAENLPHMMKSAGAVTIFSPNELEASELLGRPESPFSKEDVEAIGDHFHQAGFKAVIIRSGKRGAYGVGVFGTGSFQKFWVPPLIEDQSQVIDQTGAGNAFLGGLMAGLACGESLVDAACYGSVSSGLTISQLGLPRIAKYNETTPASELWNGGLSPRELLNQVKNRTELVQSKKKSIT